MHEAIDLFSIRISAYCLMTHHYHLLVQTPDANLSRGMRYINGVYTQRFNAHCGYDGQWFRGPLKRYWWVKTVICYRWCVISIEIRFGSV
jgi:REP element-mobilizing transposase RayT